MTQPLEQIQKIGKDNMDVALKSVGVMQKNAQAIAVETADYAKRAFEQGTATLEKLAAARTLDKAVEIQTEYLRTAYESFVSQASKMGELYAGMARDGFKAYEGVVPRPATFATR